MDTRGPGPGLRRAGRQTDRAGAKERYAPAQLLRSSRARQTGHSNGEARQGRDDSSAGNRPPFHAACRSSSSSCAKQAKNDGYSPATAPRCRLRQKKSLDASTNPASIGPGKLLWVWVCDSSSSDNIRHSAMCTPIVSICTLMMILARKSPTASATDLFCQMRRPTVSSSDNCL